MNIRIKKRIFDKLYEDLKHAEIIDCEGSILFIDREKKYWYLEYQQERGLLWWRYDFFTNFFLLFSMEQSQYEKVIAEWVEEVLNCKVDTTRLIWNVSRYKMEEVLNCKVDTTDLSTGTGAIAVEEVLNCNK